MLIIKGSLTTFYIGGEPQYLCRISMPAVQVSRIGFHRLDALNKAWKSAGLRVHTKYERKTHCNNTNTNVGIRSRLHTT